MFRIVILALVSVGFGACLTSAEPFLEATYKDDIPTLESVVGHVSGAEITTPAEALTYLEALAEAAPESMVIVPYGQSWQGRDLVLAIIAAPENMARLDEVQSDLQRLGSGVELSLAERAALVARTPAVVWLAYGVHGNEISSTDASLALAYHLLAAEGDASVNDILANTIVIIDPMQNPDGRARFVHTFESARGLAPQGDRYAAEHDEPWPSGRFNHYLFDMNRDWFALSQPETRGRVSAMQDWHPVVVVDAHEMGGDQTYFFAPSAEPFNPYVTLAQRSKQDIIGRNHARWFDRFGIEYFTREIFDAFYPGYGDMWPQLNGAIAMTYEQGSARGLLFDRKDGRTLTFRDGVQAHFLSTLSTAETVARDKTLFLGDYAAYRADGVEDGRRSDERYFVFDLSQNRWQAERLGRQLVAQGIAVQRLAGAREVCGEVYPQGALIVDTAQPTHHLIQTLLSDDTPLAKSFIVEQEDRRARGLSWQLYDVTAWSLPLMSGVISRNCKRVDMSSAEALDAHTPIEALIPNGNDAFGYAVPWTDGGQAKLVLAALEAGMIGKTSDEAFTIEGRIYPRGSVIFSRAANSDDLETVLGSMARAVGAEIVPLASGWTDSGPNLGSVNFHALQLPKVALAWGEGTSPTDAGAARYVLEVEFGLSVTPIRIRTLGRSDLDAYDVLILPDGDGVSEIGGAQMAAAISEFANEGGVVIGFADAVDYLSSEEVGLVSTKREEKWRDADVPMPVPVDERNTSVEGTRLINNDAYQASIQDTGEAPDSVPGVLVNTIANSDHWLAAGYKQAIALLVGSEIYTPLNTANGTNVFHYAAVDELLASGYLWEENRQQLAFKPFVMVQPSGAGMTICFTESPVTRAYLDGLNLLLLNAVLLGPAHAD